MSPYVDDPGYKPGAGFDDYRDLPKADCTTCRHRTFPGDKETPTCTALPAGIPFPLYFGAEHHRAPYAGDQGIRYEPDPDNPKTEEYLRRLPL